ncbi:2-dehydropantoate 2-reductase [Neobacillus mesonae]|uniref:2-dehydropantoate 2-reductase n=1 Tax=Neobacillus mesonae TaxID=1193713 RepID=UPI002041CD90|nr:2-dehydropantoate 2-reductase [Neobacillus mesonae]MCM3568797.1 2-dehydropantoate 2-reductase [Neobacillus mesonae]
MKLGIVGAGSIGLLYAAYLSRNFDVIIYTRTEEQAQEINKNGILLKKESRSSISFVSALPITRWEAMEDLAIITVKQYQLNDILESIIEMHSAPENLLFLQNGMSHLKQLEYLLVPNIYLGSIEHGALRENPYTVHHNGAGATNVALFKGKLDALHSFINSAPVEFPFVLKHHFHEMLLNKLIVNAVVNPLTAILQVKNGALMQNPYYFKTMEKLFEELSTIFKFENDLSYFQQVMDICRTTSENKSSMLKDLEANKRTEIDAILGFILTEAQKHGKEAPLTESLYNLIKGKETGGKEVLR